MSDIPLAEAIDFIVKEKEKQEREQERGTCKNIGDKHNPLHQVDQFVCSECNIHLEDWVQIVYDYDWGYPPEKHFYEYELRYCPSCGKKIVE